MLAIQHGLLPSFQARSSLVYNLGIPLYYCLLGRRLLGKAMKYPLLRLGYFPEWILKHKLYLDFTGKRPPRFRVPDFVPIPEHAVRPCLALPIGWRGRGGLLLLASPVPVPVQAWASLNL